MGYVWKNYILTQMKLGLRLTRLASTERPQRFQCCGALNVCASSLLVPFFPLHPKGPLTGMLHIRSALLTCRPPLCSSTPAFTCIDAVWSLTKTHKALTWNRCAAENLSPQPRECKIATMVVHVQPLCIHQRLNAKSPQCMCMCSHSSSASA